MRFFAIDWDYAVSLCRKVTFQILDDNFKPDKIVALAKGGWFVALAMSDYLDVEIVNLELRKAQNIEGNRILVVDDFVNTGKTMSSALNFVRAEEVRTASLLVFQKSKFIPHYFGDFITDETWIIFPWNVFESLSPIIISSLEKGAKDVASIKSSIAESIEPINLELAGIKLEDILAVLEKKRIVERLGNLWRLSV